MSLPATPPGNLKYARPSDIVTANLVWSVEEGTISVDTNYGLASLYDGKMAKPAKFIDEPIVAVRIVGDAGVATRFDALSLPNHNLPAGTVCRAELNASNSWGAPTVSVDMTVGAAGLDGHRASPWADFTVASGYDVAGFRYVSLYVPVTSVSPWLGEMPVISTLRQFSVWPQFGQRGIHLPFLENIYTEFAQRRTLRRRIKQRQVSYPFQGTEQDFADLVALVEDCGGVAQPFFLVANSTVKTDGGLYGRLTPETASRVMAAEEWFNLDGFTVAFEEDSRSLPF